MISDLYRETLIDIFSRLPAKSIGKCRCLGKKWRYLLSTSLFIESHFNRQTDQENLILIAPSQFLHSIRNDAVSRKLQFPDIWIEIVGSCDGLVLLINDEHKKILLNPITRQQVKVPNSPDFRRKRSFRMHGFGYDSFTDDYKIVTLSSYDMEDTFVDVYSVRRGVWKRVEKSPYNHAVSVISSGAYVNGAIHWLASRRGSAFRSVIVAFNLADEVFDEIPAPSDVDARKIVFNKLGVLGRCLCMIDTRSHNGTDVWILEKYGVGDSWTKFSVQADYDLRITRPLCYIGDEEVVFLTEKRRLIVYNLKEGTLRDMIVDGAPAIFADGCAFVESLISPVSN